jgi:hypothetical protein
VLSSELQAQNDDTLNKIYDNQDSIDASREWLLQDKAGIAPRMYHFDMDSVSVKLEQANAQRHLICLFVASSSS